MKRKTFYHLSLSLPFLVLLFSGLITVAAAIGGQDLFISGGFLSILLGIVAFLSLSALIWAPLYAWTAAALLLWSWGRPADETRRMYMFSPLLLGSAMGIPAALIDLTGTMFLVFWSLLHILHLDSIMTSLAGEFIFAPALSLGIMWLLMAVPCFVIGYLLVGVVVLLEKMLKRANFFREEQGSLVRLAPARSEGLENLSS